MPLSIEYSVLAAMLRLFNETDYQRLRATLYYNLETILAALDVAAGAKP